MSRVFPVVALLGSIACTIALVMVQWETMAAWRAPVQRAALVSPNAPAARAIAPGHEAEIRPVPMRWVVISTSLILGNIVAGVLLGLARMPDRPRAPASPHNDRQAMEITLTTWTTMLGAFLVALIAVAHFHFRMDDYVFLPRATHDPSYIVHESRLLSTVVHYRIGILLGGGKLWFATVNLFLLAAMSSCWAILLRRIGLPLDAAVLAGALHAMGPGTFFLLRSGNGVEHLSATTCLMATLLLTDLAAREQERPKTWRYGILVLALCLSLLGVLMKWPLMVILPPSCWLWGRWFIDHPAPPMHRSRTYLAFAVVVFGAIYALTWSSVSSIGFLPSRHAMAAMSDRVFDYAITAVMLFVFAARWGARRESGMQPTWTSSVGAVARARVGVFPLYLWALSLSLLWFLPFALHGRYEGEAYYGMLASAPLTAVGAMIISIAARQWRGRGWRLILGTFLACLFLVPVGDITSELQRSATEYVPAWLDEVHVLTAQRERPDRVVVAPSCPPDPSDVPLSRQMDDVFRESGIWWATGWFGVPIEFHDQTVAPSSDKRIVTLGYCPGRPATIE